MHRLLWADALKRARAKVAPRRTHRSLLSVRVRASTGDLADLQRAKEALAKNLASKQHEWNAQAHDVGGVLSEGLDSAPSADTTPLPEADLNTFHPLLAAAGDALVVVDFYTSWCGPCKLIAPKLALWNAELQPAVQFIKVNCNKEFAPLGKQLGIKVAPTFHLYRKGALLAVLTGAKEEALRALIEEHRTAK